MARMDRILGGDLRILGNITRTNSNVWIGDKMEWWSKWFAKVLLVMALWALGMALLGFI